ncbi:hypothetical protein K2173_008366 [Erythroxylum novogranatense]|uniref:F-box protein n=1 Tax=Erythroxylum novogranatense TaxID=1862640 RepID=A0AAV8TIS3_9ROSI|nr:hypothetical protein K2173_008366 [Erythroxylum novogranatense]
MAFECQENTEVFVDFICCEGNSHPITKCSTKELSFPGILPRCRRSITDLPAALISEILNFYCERWGLPIVQTPLSQGPSDEKSWKELFVEREIRTKTFLARDSVDVLYGHTEAVRTSNSFPFGFCQAHFHFRSPYLFDLKGSEVPNTEYRLWEHKGPITSLVLDLTRMYSGSWDMSVRVWERSSLKCLKVLRHSDWVWVLFHMILHLQAHPATLFLLEEKMEPFTCLRSLATPWRLMLLRWQLGFLSPVDSLAFEFPWLVSALSSDGKMSLIDVGKLLRRSRQTFRKKIARVNNFDIGADYIVCGGEEGVARMWNFAKALEIERRVRALRGICDQCSVAAKKNGLDGERSGEWHNKRVVNGELKA